AARWTGGFATGAAEAIDVARPHVHGEPLDLRVGQTARLRRHAARSQHRTPGGGRRFSDVRVRAGNRQEPGVPDEDSRRVDDGAEVKQPQRGRYRMSFISGKHMPRRTMLRGLGATVALPFLDAMVPARGLWSRTAKA